MTNQFLFTPELLKSCTVELSEKYNIGYSYEDDGIYLSVCKLENGVAAGGVVTIVATDIIPWPCKDEFDILKGTV